MIEFAHMQTTVFPFDEVMLRSQSITPQPTVQSLFMLVALTYLLHVGFGPMLSCACIFFHLEKCK